MIPQIYFFIIQILLNQFKVYNKEKMIRWKEKRAAGLEPVT